MTIKDIAQKCGVSVTTVSRVINNHPYVKEDIRARVLAVIEEEHFIPHSGAVELVKHQADAIGVVVRGLGNPFFQDIITVLENAIDEAGFSFMMLQIGTGDDELRAAASFAKEKKLKGVILLGGRYDWTEEEAAVMTTPFICCTFSNRYGDVSSSRYSAVGIDDKDEAYRAVKYLIENGHEKIAVLVPSIKDHSISQLRYEGYCRALREADIPFDEKLVCETGSYEMQEAHETVARMIAEGLDYTAIFAISDYMAIAATKALADHGRRVPDDCSVIGIDGINLSRYMIPTLTTLVQPATDIAHNTVEILIRMIKGKSRAAQFLLNTELREGGSVRCIKA